jgi:hypothetical protein
MVRAVMAEDNSGMKRRNVLKATSGVVAAGAFSGLASASDATVEVNVGYKNDAAVAPQNRPPARSFGSSTSTR